MLVIVNEPFFKLFFFSLDQSVFIFKFQFSLHSNGVNLIIDFLADNIMDWIPLLKLKKWWLMILIFFEFILLWKPYTLFAFFHEIVFELVIERIQSLFVVSQLVLAFKLEVWKQMEHFLYTHQKRDCPVLSRLPPFSTSKIKIQVDFSSILMNQWVINVLRVHNPSLWPWIWII